MSFRVIPTPRFMREAKALAKRHHSLAKDLHELSKKLLEDPQSGTPLGGGLFKLRLAITSKGTGKSGGGRVITYVVTADKEIYLLTIYDKSARSTITTRELKAMLRELE